MTDAAGAEAAERSGLWRTAVEMWLVLAEGTQPEFLLRASYAAENGGFRREAEWLAAEAAESCPKLVDASVKAGMLAYEREDFALASEWFDKAVRIEERQGVLTLLGAAQRRAGDLAAARISLTRSIELNPADDEAHHVMGLILAELEPDAAVEYFRRALELDPTIAHSARELGLTYWKLGRLSEAEETLRTAIASSATDSWAHYYLGQILIRRGDLEAGCVEVEKSVELESDNAFFLKGLGVARAAAAQVEAAEDAFKAAILNDPDDPDVLYAYGKFLHDHRSTRSAVRYLRKAVDLGLQGKNAEFAIKAIGC